MTTYPTKWCVWRRRWHGLATWLRHNTGKSIACEEILGEMFQIVHQTRGACPKIGREKESSKEI